MVLALFMKVLQVLTVRSNSAHDFWRFSFTAPLFGILFSASPLSSRSGCAKHSEQSTSAQFLLLWPSQRCLAANLQSTLR